MKIVALDFETADYHADSACALGLITIVDGVITSRRALLIRPPRKEFVFTYIHGITWKDVSKEPTFEEHLPTINSIIGDADYIAAHNAGFDRKVLLTCYAEAGKRPPDFSKFPRRP